MNLDRIQVGSRFVASHEASAHIAFKNTVIQTSEGETQLTLKELTPVRLVKNEFYNRVQAAYAAGDTELGKRVGASVVKDLKQQLAYYKSLGTPMSEAQFMQNAENAYQNKATEFAVPYSVMNTVDPSWVKSISDA